MAKSNKPIIWGLFAAGGELASLFVPVLIVLTLLAATGHVPDRFGYEKLYAYASHWFGKISIFTVLFLLLWSQAHRLRITFFDFGVRADVLIATVVYSIAALCSVALTVYLSRF